MGKIFNREVGGFVTRLLNQSPDEATQVDAIIDAARPVDSPIHYYFDWDNNVAGDKWRKYQAKRLMQVVFQEYVVEDRTFNIRVATHLPSDRSGFRLTTDMIEDSNMRSELINDALSMIRAFQAKFRILRELTGVFDAMEVAEKDLREAQAREHKKPRTKVPTSKCSKGSGKAGTSKGTKRKK